MGQFDRLGEGMALHVTAVMAGLLCVLACFAAVTAEKINNAEFERKVVEYVEAGMRCHDNPGLTLAVVKNGQTILARGFGKKHLDNTDPVTNETLFGIASVSKSFAATLMLKLIELNDNITLSTKVREVFNNDNVFGDYLRRRYTTIEDLMAHRLGLPSNNNIRLGEKLTRANLVDRIKHLDAKGGFRTSFYYSNLMYGLVTRAAEIIGGKSWEDLVTEHLLTPLGMTSTTFVTTASPDDLNLAQGYQDRYGELKPVPFEFSRHWGDLCGSGCILSNAVDMAEWMKFHIRAGRNSQNEIVLDSDMLAHAHAEQNSISPSSYLLKYFSKPITPETLSLSNYGLGWRLGHYQGYPIITHSGSTYGYRALVTMLPTMDIGVYVGLTGDDKNYLFRSSINLYITDLLLGGDAWLNASTVCSFPEPWATYSKSSTTRPRTDIAAGRDLSQYEGEYENTGYGKLQIYVNGSENTLVMTFGVGEFVLYPKSNKDEFYAQGRGLLENVRDFSTLRFKEKDGQISSLEAVSFETSDPPLFQRKVLQRSNRNAATNAGQRISPAIALPVLYLVVKAVMYTV